MDTCYICQQLDENEKLVKLCHTEKCTARAHEDCLIHQSQSTIDMICYNCQQPIIQHVGQMDWRKCFTFYCKIIYLIVVYVASFTSYIFLFKMNTLFKHMDIGIGIVGFMLIPILTLKIHLKIRPGGMRLIPLPLKGSCKYRYYWSLIVVWAIVSLMITVGHLMGAAALQLLHYNDTMNINTGITGGLIYYGIAIIVLIVVFIKCAWGKFSQFNQEHFFQVRYGSI